MTQKNKTQFRRRRTTDQKKNNTPPLRGDVDSRNTRGHARPPSTSAHSRLGPTRPARPRATSARPPRARAGASVVCTGYTDESPVWDDGAPDRPTAGRTRGRSPARANVRVAPRVGSTVRRACDRSIDRPTDGVLRSSRVRSFVPSRAIDRDDDRRAESFVGPQKRARVRRRRRPTDRATDRIDGRTRSVIRSFDARGRGTDESLRT